MKNSDSDGWKIHSKQQSFLAQIFYFRKLPKRLQRLQQKKSNRHLERLVRAFNDKQQFKNYENVSIFKPCFYSVLHSLIAGRS